MSEDPEMGELRPDTADEIERMRLEFHLDRALLDMTHEDPGDLEP